MSLSEIKAKYPGLKTFIFGDSKELCDELTELVISGKKIATCEALSTYASGEEAMPELGRVDLALTWEQKPAVAIRTIEIEIRRFSEVEEGFALDEGENSDLAGWRKDHQDYFERNGHFNPEMKVVCERFEVVEVY
ncbi:MAG: hypothetical protein ACI84O_000845 [Myxococcota bacterium]|jgi:uncharacterized protein YhfF